MKLEGKSPDSKSPGHIFEYHIGGYKEPSNCIRTVTLEIFKPKNKAVVHTDNDMLHIAGTTPIENSKTVSIGIIADISMILSSHTVIDFSKLSSVTDFHNVKTIAENYKDMFYVTRLVQQ